MRTETDDLMNAGEVVEARGRAWTFSHLGPSMRAAFSAWLKGRARAGLQAERKGAALDEEAYREALASLNAEMAAGAYNWGSPLDPEGMGSAVRAALGQTEGRVKLVQLLLEPRHDELPAAEVLAIITDNPEGVGEAVKACLGATRNAAPNVQKGKERVDPFPA